MYRQASVVWLGVAFVTACVAPPEDEEGVAIGALVPFTGAAAAGGANYERAMLLAVEHLNAQGGLLGQPFRMVTRDSHSSVERTLGSLDDILDEAPIGLVGPADVEQVAAVRERLGDSGLAHVLASSVTHSRFPDEAPGSLVRLAPSAEIMACALANRLYSEQVPRVVASYSADPYRQAFAQAFVTAFEGFRLGGHVGAGLALPLPDVAVGFRDVISQALDFAPDAVVLATEASTGASLVQDWETLSAVRWFFESSLGSDEFLRNVSPETVQGAIGIGLALPPEAPIFAEAYTKRWSGEAPLNEAYLYYDAVMSIGLASIAAAAELGHAPEPADVSARILQVLRAPGLPVSWQDLDEATRLVSEGSDIQYIGAAGRLALDDGGRIDPNAALLRFWKVDGEAIVPEQFGVCPSSELTFE